MKILSVVVIALSLIGGANLANAQSSKDLGVVTGTESNAAQHDNGGSYESNRR